MYKYAQILDNKVHWIFTDEMTLEEIGQHKFNLEQIKLIDITNMADVQEGYDYSNGAFVNTAVSTSFADLQKQCIAKFGAEFAKRRDAITWAVQADGSVFGYDRKTEDVTNFLAAMQRAYLGADTYYKVYLNNVETKAMKLHTYKMFHDVLEQSAQEQIAAYQKYEAIKKQILEECDTIDELNAITW